jgi:hypothetical protein
MLFAFDLLDGVDYRPLPLHERKGHGHERRCEGGGYAEFICVNV